MPNPGFIITAIDRPMAMIPTIICKILMPLEHPVQILFSFRICLIVTTYLKRNLSI